MVNGAIAGLVCITPACGYVNTTGAFFIGLTGGVACYFGSQIKYIFRIDDSLDAFGVHAIGGMTGVILTGFFANEHIGGEDGVFYANRDIGGHQLAKQIYAIVVVAGWAAFASTVILSTLRHVLKMELRVTDAEEKCADHLVAREEPFVQVEQKETTTFEELHPIPLHPEL